MSVFIEYGRRNFGSPTVFLRTHYRDADGTLKKRTCANLSGLPEEEINKLRDLINNGEFSLDGDPDVPTVVRALSHGHVAAALATAHKTALDRLLLSTATDPRSRRHCDLVLAMITDRLIEPKSKLRFVASVNEETAVTSLGRVLELGHVKPREAYAALDWLLENQPRIEKGLAKRHLKDGTLVLYDVSSSYLEGHCCPLAQRGYSRDHRPDRLQIVYGLLCSREGIPVAVEVFDGNTSDPATVGKQIEKLKKRFGIEHVVLVGDRGMITSARIQEDLEPAGFDWVSCLRAPQIRKLAEAGGPLQMSLFDQRNLVEISAPHLFPGERLIVCRNQELEGERRRNRNELLDATERDLKRIEARVNRKGPQSLKTAAEIGKAVGAVLHRRKMAKHFKVKIEDGRISWKRRQREIEEEERLDGIYVIRTSVSSKTLDAQEAVEAYKDLSRVERAFRSMKNAHLEVRPIRHWTADHVRAHVFLCMLSYYVEWHMRKALAPLLYHDTELEWAKEDRVSPVSKTVPSESVLAKKASKRTSDGLPVSSFEGLMDHLGTLTLTPRNLADGSLRTFSQFTGMTPLQREAFQLLGIRPTRMR